MYKNSLKNHSISLNKIYSRSPCQKNFKQKFNTAHTLFLLMTASLHTGTVRFMINFTILFIICFCFIVFAFNILYVEICRGGGRADCCAHGGRWHRSLGRTLISHRCHCSFYPCLYLIDTIQVTFWCSVQCRAVAVSPSQSCQQVVLQSKT